MTAEDIVRTLASTDPCGYSEEGEDYHWCALCRASVPVRPDDHADTCVWRLAVEWAHQHDGGGGA